MKKAIIIGIICLLSAFVICFLAGAFIHVSFNIAKWHEKTRIIVCVIPVVLTFIISGTTALDAIQTQHLIQICKEREDEAGGGSA